MPASNPMEVPLYVPNAAFVATTALTDFIGFCAGRSGRSFASHAAFEDFSRESFEEFWGYFLAWSGIAYEGDAGRVCTSRDCETASFFPDIRLNFTENLLRLRDPAESEQRALAVYRAECEPHYVTRGDLRRRVRRLATALGELGVGERSRVALIAQNDDQSVVAALASAAVGALFATAAPDLAATAIVDRFVQVGPSLLFCHLASPFPDIERQMRARIAEVAAALPSLTHLIVLDDGAPPPDLSVPVVRLDDLVHDATQELTDCPRFPFDHPLWIGFTSGTTGKPKCLIHSAGGVLLEQLKEMVLHYDVRTGDRVFFQASTGWVIWNLLLTGLGAGAQIVLNSRPVTSPEALWRLVADEGVTIFGTSPAYLRLCEIHGYTPRDQVDLSQLRSIFAMGSILDDRHQAWVMEEVKLLPVKSGYGATDFAGGFFCPNPNIPDYRGQCQSRSLGLDVRVLQIGEFGFPGPVGEVVCANPFPSRPVGMLGDPDGSRMHATYYAQNPGYWTQGDLMEITPQRGAILHGRSDGVLNIRGMRCGPSEIYRAVRPIPGVANALVAARSQPDVPGGNELVLLVVLKDEGRLDEALVRAIKDAIRIQLSPTHVPDVIADVPDLPMTHNGKLSERSVNDAINSRPISNRAALRNPECLGAIVAHPALAVPVLAPARLELPAPGLRSTEVMVRAVWEAVLGRGPIATDANFFDLGGDSMMAIRILLELEKALNRRLPITILYEASTIALLSQFIDGNTGLDRSLLVRLKDGDETRPLFIVHGMSGYVMELRALARHIRYRGAIYGIQAKGLLAECVPLCDVQAMAVTYVAAIRAVQRHGPYHLAGYSLGGLVAIEMTRLLLTAGETVAPIHLIETPIDERYWPTAVWLNMFGRRVLTHVDRFRRTPVRRLAPYFAGRVAGIAGHFVRRFHPNTRRRFAAFYIEAKHPDLQRVLEACIEAAAAHQPRRLQHPACLYVANQGVFKAADPTKLWSRYVGSLVVESVPGNHESLIRALECETLAAAVSRHLTLLG